MAYFHGQKIEPSPDAEAKRQALHRIMQRVTSDDAPDEKLWQRFLSEAGCPEFYEVGQAISRWETARKTRIIKCLEEFSCSTDWNIRDSVARVLATMLDGSAKPILKRLLSDPEEALVRYAALKALWNLGHNFTEQEQAVLLHDSSEMVRAQAEEFFNS